ncbi:MAG: immunity 53 family protein [Gemmatimonadota bacterium]|nr:immunity 53 family protein [Gemmatimonadota bacterium]
MDALTRLQQWYAAHCDGDWESGYGIEIYTVSNPGWTLKVHISDLTLEDLPFEPVEINRSATDRILCSVRDGKFVGHGGTTNLAEMIEIFLEWAQHEDDHEQNGRIPDEGPASAPTG